MASIRTIVRSLVFALALFVAAGSAVRAQSPFDERARTILLLYDTGQKDSAYQLIEPLKREARFVPSVIFTRAQMTPDDRALSLYREIIALEPGGAWADDAAYQLVRRYIDKKDSMASHTWATVLRTNYPRSPFVAMSDDTLRGITAWELDEDPDGPILADNAKTTKPAARTSVDAAKAKADAAKAKTNAAKAKADAAKAKTDEAKPAETYKKSGMRGFALQVGLFPTKAAAETRAKQLVSSKLKAVALPKTVDGKKQYALVVGPYKTLAEAAKKKPAVASGCDCPAFVVKVE